MTQMMTEIIPLGILASAFAKEKK